MLYACIVVNVCVTEKKTISTLKKKNKNEQGG